MTSIRRAGALVLVVVAILATAALLGRSTASPGAEAGPSVPVAGQPFDPGSVTMTPAAAPTDGTEPPNPTAGTRSVIGADDRIAVQDTTAYPARAIGRLTFRQRGQSYFCTAFLISADTVATAGHCVHDGLSDSNDGYSVDVVFTPGQRGVGATAAPFGSCAGVELTVTDPWLQGRDEQFDLGFVRLDCSVGDTVGWFGFEPGGADDPTGAAVTVQGYPFDKPSGTQWTDDDVIDPVEGRQSFYGADTAPGQSGSPVFQMRTCRGVAGACVVAVHGYGLHGFPPHRTRNHGVTVTAAVAGEFHTAVEVP